MNQTNMGITQTFYTAFGEKNVESMKKHLHPDVQLITPLSKLQRKEVYLEAVKLYGFFNALSIRAPFGEGDQAVVVV